MGAKNSIFHNSQTEIHFSVHMHKWVHFVKNELETNRLHAKGEEAKKRFHAKEKCAVSLRKTRDEWKNGAESQQKCTNQ